MQQRRPPPRARGRPARDKQHAEVDGGAFAGLHELLGLDASAPEDDPMVDVDEATDVDGVGCATRRHGRPRTGAHRHGGVGATGDIDRAVAIVTIIEAVQENPAVVIAAQLRKAKDELMSEMKSSGVEYEERMERLRRWSRHGR